MSAITQTGNEYVKMLTEWRAEALSEIEPLEAEMMVLAAKIESSKKRLLHFEGLLAIEGWTPDTTENQQISSTSSKGNQGQDSDSDSNSDYNSLARQWLIGIGDGQKFTTSDFSKWLEPILNTEPNRNSIRNSFLNLLADRQIQVEEQGKGRRSTVYKKSNP